MLGRGSVGGQGAGTRGDTVTHARTRARAHALKRHARARTRARRHGRTGAQARAHGRAHAGAQLLERGRKKANDSAACVISRKPIE